MKKLATLVLLAALLTLNTTLAHAESIRIGGGGTPIDNILKPVKDGFEKSSGITIDLNFSNASIAFKQLASDQNNLDASAAGLSLENLLATMKKEGFEVKDPTAFIGSQIGKGKLYTIVNKSNPISALSKEQLKGIFTGKIANWKEVGGSDSPIILVLSKINPATNGAYKMLVMDNVAYANDVLDAGRFEDLREKVAATPEAIGFGPVSMLDDTIKLVKTDEYSRPIILVTKGKPAPKVQKLIDYINNEGKKFIKE